MSLKTWKAEFYPVPVSKTSRDNAIAHSLRKWKGLNARQLARHDLERYGRYIRDLKTGTEWEIGDRNCALCKWHNKLTCVTCPLYQARSARCDVRTWEEEVNNEHSPYSAWILRGNTKPMLYWLKRCQS